MTTAPTRRRIARPDPDVRAIGLLALAMILAAAIVGVTWTRTLGAHGPVPRGGEVIGATFAPLGDDAVVVDSVRADGAARRGGLLVGDVIESVGGAPIADVDAAEHALTGGRLDIRVRRGKREIDLHLDASGEDARGQQDPVDRG